MPFRLWEAILWPAAVEDVINHDAVAADKAVAAEHAAHQVMERGVGMRVGTDFHTDTAVGAARAPESVTRLRIEDPFFHTPAVGFVTIRNGAGWAIGGAFFAGIAEILNAEIGTFILSERQVRCHYA